MSDLQIKNIVCLLVGLKQKKYLVLVFLNFLKVTEKPTRKELNNYPVT